MSLNIDKNQIQKREIRFAWHLPRNNNREDAHYIKEQITLKDGSVQPHTYLVRDYKRPIWVTSPDKRNHKDKKEFELKDNLIQTYTTQSDLNKTIANLLQQPHLVNNPKLIKQSPYVYGYDQTSTSIIKLKSLIKNNNIQSPYSVAFFDIETDVNTKEITIATIAYKNAIYTCINKKIVQHVSNVEQRVKEALERYLPRYKDSSLSIEVCNNELELIKSIFEVAHKLKPDFLAIWNMDFDIPRVLERLEFHSANPIDYLCDPDIPRNYRMCRYKQGIKKKVTASGQVKPINPALQWHTLILTASFYVIDAMCVYRQLRMAAQEEPSNLNYILQKELGTRKLTFDVADQYSGVVWHLFMSEKYPIEYIVYNIYDTLGMAELDSKVKDLQSTLPSFAGMTDFGKFNSNPKKITDALFKFGLERSRVIGTGCKIVKEEKDIDDEDTDLDDEDLETLGLKGWIQLLPQNQLIHNGLKCLEEFPEVVTNIRGMVIDMDSVSSYPTCTEVANVSKETCSSEIISIAGVQESLFKLENISLLLGGSNTLDYFSTMFELPKLDEIDKLLSKYI